MAIAFIRRSRLSFSCADGQHDYRWGGTADIHQQCVICDAVVDGSAHTYKVKYTWQDNHENGCTAENSCECGYVKNTETSSDVSTTTHAATCTEDEWYTCTAKFSTLGSAVCGAQHVIEGTATGHDPSDYTYDTAAHWKNCNTCGTQLDYATHTSVTDSGYDATCTEDGLTDGSHCSVCDMVITAQETIDATGHDWGGWIIDEEATENENGSKHRVCSNCDEEETAVIPALGHTTHTEVIIKGYDATCTSTGLTDGVKCSVCEMIITPQEVIPLKNHSEVTVPGYAATCTESGLTDGVKCSVCGKVITAQTSIAKLNHSYTNYTSDGNATCAQDGTKTAFCDYGCGNKQTVTDVNSKLNVAHTEVIDNAVEATCTTSGLTVGKHCAICNAILIAQQTVPAKGHTAGEPVEEDRKEPTCTTDGSYNEVTYCSVCNTKLGSVLVTIPSPGHDDSNNSDNRCDICGAILCTDNNHVLVPIPGKAATCTSTGLTDGEKCSACGKIITTQQVIDKLEHDYSIVVKNGLAATCVSDGYTDTLKCSMCGDVKASQTIGAFGHDWESGEYPCTCERCGLHDPEYNTEESPGQCIHCGVACKHDFSNLIVDEVSPTCTEPGYTAVYECGHCGVRDGGEAVGKPLGHSYSSETGTCVVCNAPCNHVEDNGVIEDITYPTCSTDGSQTVVHKCTICGMTTQSYDVVLPATNDHEGGETVIENYVAPTCTSYGSYDEVVYCKVCNVELERHENHSEEPIGHDWVTSEEKIAPTCTEPGREAIRNCGNCGIAADGSGDEIGALGHTGGTATCTTQAKCTRCGSYYGEFGEHSQEWEDGMTCYCDQCESTIHHYTTDPGDPDNPCYCEYCGTVHDWVTSVEATDPTCTEDGNTEGKYCGTCGETIQSETIKAPGHEWFEGVCQNCGTVCTHDVDEDTCQCKICDEYIHNYVDYEYVAPTCEEDGHEGGYYCTRCGAGEDYTVIKATGHDFSNLISDEVSPTCTEAGYTAVYECGHCGARDGGDEIEALGHEFVEGDETNCQCQRCFEYIHSMTGCRCDNCGEYVHTDGNGDYICDACGDSLCTDHDWVTSVEATEPTCTEDGNTEGKYCGICGETVQSEIIEALGHDYFEGKCQNCGESCPHNDMSGCLCNDCGEYDHNYVNYEDVEPTCTTPGHTGGYYCTRCGAGEDYTVIEATGHDPVTIPGENATCTTDGYTDKVECGHCGILITNSEIIPATGHSYFEGVCENCGESCSHNNMDGEHDGCCCPDCGEYVHDWTDYEDIEETCTTPGKSGGYYCSSCGTVGQEQTTIPAKGHTYDMDCYCVDCGEPSHNEVSYDDEEPTCGTDGWTGGTYCEDCWEVLEERTRVPATGNHSYFEGTCEDCGHVCTHDSYDPEHDEVCPDCGEYVSSGSGGTPVEPDACLIASTPILMADGTEKAISEVRAGDMVKSWDIENNEYIDVKVLGAYCTGTEQDWSVHTFDNGRTLDISNEHRIFCKEKNSVRQSTDWRAGNTAISLDGAETKYYDMDVRHDDHATNRYTMLTENNLYFANGILCGHHAKSKYKFVNRGWLEATPEELEQYRITAALYDELDRAFTNEEYLKEAAPLREQLLKAKEDIRLNRHEISKLKRDMDKQKRSKLSRKDQDAFDNKRNSYRSNARSIKDNNKAIRAQLDELKTKFGITTKSKYQIWKEAYDLDMNYIKNRSAK